jgi:hypothetical protein
MLLNEQGVLQELLQNKYLSHKALTHVKAKPTDSLSGRGCWESKTSSLVEARLF